MNNYNYNQNENQKTKLSRSILGLIFFGAVVVAFIFGFAFSTILRVKPILPSPSPSTSDAYDKLYEFIDKNHHYDIDEDRAFYLKLKSLVDSLDDPYTEIVYIAASNGPSGSLDADPLEETFEGLGISFTYEDFEMKISDIMRHSPAEAAHIYPGDRIIGLVINGERIIFRDKNFNQDQALPYIKGVAGDSKTLIVKHLDNTTQDISVVYEKFARPTVIAKELDSNNAYIKILQFEAKTDEVFAEELNKLEATVLTDSSKTLILDLRNNPGGFLDTVTNIMQKLLKEETEKPYVFGVKPTKNRDQITSFPMYRGKLKEAKPYDIKVLVNEKSASASEMLAAALHYSGGYEIYGANTFGKNVYQSRHPIVIGDGLVLELKYTEGNWYYGDPEKNSSFEIIDKDTNPIPVITLEPEKYLTFEVPMYEKDVKLDDVNSTLIRVQKMLNAKYDLSLRVDGYLDAETETALKQYQTEKGFTVVSGEYTLDTFRSMYTDYVIALEDYINDNQISAVMSWRL